MLDVKQVLKVLDMTTELCAVVWPVHADSGTADKAHAGWQLQQLNAGV